MSNAASLQVVETTTPARSVRERLCMLRDSLASTFAERDELAEAVILAIVSKAHVCVVGPPGAAKSALLMSLQSAIGASFFDTLLSRFSVEDDVFGPRSIAAMRDDRWERKLDGYLAASDFAFLDEVFKANASVLNSLLRILNERVYEGKKRPLWTVVAASNELQEDESLNALWDRFLLRLDVSYVSSEDTFKRLVSKRPPRYVPPCTVTMDEIADAHAEAMALSPELSDAVVTQLLRLKKDLEASGVVLSDRRWMAVGDLLRAAAWLDGASEVEVDHMSVLRLALWNKPAERARVTSALQAIDSGIVTEVTKVVDDALRAWATRPTEAAAYRAAQSGITTTLEDARKKVEATLSGPLTRNARARIERKAQSLEAAWGQLAADLQKRFGFR